MNRYDIIRQVELYDDDTLHTRVMRVEAETPIKALKKFVETLVLEGSGWCDPLYVQHVNLNSADLWIRKLTSRGYAGETHFVALATKETR